jgi:TRAP transporter 4TM/12TM fusion protein
VLRALRGVTGPRLITALAILFSLFHLYTGLMGVLEQYLQRLIHMGFGLGLMYLASLLAPSSAAPRQVPGFWDRLSKWLALAALLAYVGYFLQNYAHLTAERFAYIEPLTSVQVIVGTGMVLVVLDASRRLLGWSLPVIAVGCIVYAVVGRWVPGIFEHSGYSWNKIIDNLLFTTDGILGVAIGVTSTYVVLFVIFGTFLAETGFGELLLNLALGVAGKLRGGPGKVSVIANGLMGMISGSAVASTLTVGAVTLPIMEKTGYDRDFSAGAVAVGGCGGQIMPPVMGAQAFLMMQYTGIPYIEIAKLSLIPAILYYAGIWFALDIVARKGPVLEITSSVDLSNWKRKVLGRVHLVVPMILLVFLMVMGYTPMYAVVASILSLVGLSFVRRETRLTPERAKRALREGAMVSLTVVAAASVAGIIIGMLTLTGIGERFSYSLLALAKGNVFVALVFAMFISLLLGLGLPTIPAYLVQVSMVVPALVKLGLPPYAAHMFAIYYACLSMITPPECVPAYAAAALVKANPAKVGWLGFAIGAPSYLLPFFFVYNPGILMVGSAYQIVYATVMSSLMIFALALGMWGYWHRALSWGERGLCLSGAVLLFIPTTLLNLAGIVVIAFVLFRQRKLASSVASESA